VFVAPCTRDLAGTPTDARCVAPAVPYHVTRRGTNGQRLLFTDSDRKACLKLLASNKDEAGVRILACCLMSNHVQLGAMPEGGDSLAVLLRRAHGRYARC
jgi:putative transposase